MLGIDITVALGKGLRFFEVMVQCDFVNFSLEFIDRVLDDFDVLKIAFFRLGLIVLYR